MLKQRNGLIPNLVAAVKGYMGYENATLTKITELRSLMLQTDKEQKQIQLCTELSKELADVRVTAENYPELKADQQFRRLEENIAEMELQLQAARRTFNAAAVDFNNYVQMFPSSIVASVKNYQPYELITIPESETGNVDIRNLLKNNHYSN
jgi:LemA protein